MTLYMPHIKRKRHLLSIAVFSVFFASLFMRPSAALCGEIGLTIQAKKGPLTITVSYGDGQEAWAQLLLNETPGFIRIAERYFNKPFPYNTLTIEPGDDPLSHAYLSERKITLVKTYNPLDNPALLFHEIAHFWLYYYGSNTNEDWLIEGMASFVPVALREKGLLPDTDKYHGSIDRWWGLYWKLSDSIQDVPLYPFAERMRSLVYTKSYRLQYLIYYTLGKAKYQTFIRWVINSKRRSPTTVIRKLTSLKTANWKRMFSGWILGNTYKTISLLDFVTDDDNDGLSNADEYRYQTKRTVYDTDNDKLPDGGEVAIGTNPRKANADGLDLLLSHGPFADGNDQEWQYFNSWSVQDAANDSTDAAWTDMLSMSGVSKNGFLYLLIRTAEKPLTPSNILFSVLIDTNQDYYTDEEFAFFLNGTNDPWRYSYSTNSSDFPLTLKAGVGEAIEMAIPLSSISASSFQILPIIRNNSTKTNYDEWGEWITVTP